MGPGWHKERLSGSDRWPRLGQLSSLSGKRSLSFCRIPTPSQPLATASHTERWVVVQVTVNAPWKETTELLHNKIHAQGCRDSLQIVVFVNYNAVSIKKEKKDQIQQQLEIKTAVI